MHTSLGCAPARRAPSRSWLRSGLMVLTSLVMLSGTAIASPGKSAGRHTAAGLIQRPAKQLSTGVATYYGAEFHGRRTASGEVFNKNALVAAHPRYPLGTQVKVTNLRNGQIVVVRIIDRAPAASFARNGVIIDLSEGAASKLGMIRQGRAKVAVEILASATRLKG